MRELGWCRFMLENYLTLVKKYVALLRDTESKLVTNVPAGTDEASVLIRTPSHTLYALLATLTTGRSLTLVQRVPNRHGFEAWRQVVAENAPKTAGRRFAMLQAVLQLGVVENSAKFGDTWKTWEHQVDVYEKFATSRLDDDVEISVVLREAPTKLRDNLLVTSQQFERNYNKLRAIVQTYLNINKSWIANDFRNDTKESHPMEVDYIAKGKGIGIGTDKAKGRGKAAKSDRQDKDCFVCGKKGHLARDCWSRTNQDRNSERGGGCKSGLRCSKRVDVHD